MGLIFTICNQKPVSQFNTNNTNYGCAKNNLSNLNLVKK